MALFQIRQAPDMPNGSKGLTSEFHRSATIFRTLRLGISANAYDPLPNSSDLITNERVLFVVPALRSLRSLHARNNAKVHSMDKFCQIFINYGFG